MHLTFLLQLSKNGKLTAPAINVHDAVTRTMINNYYCQKESIVDVLKVISINFLVRYKNLKKKSCVIHMDKKQKQDCRQYCICRFINGKLARAHLRTYVVHGLNITLRTFLTFWTILRESGPRTTLNYLINEEP